MIKLFRKLENSIHRKFIRIEAIAVGLASVLFPIVAVQPVLAQATTDLAQATTDYGELRNVTIDDLTEDLEDYIGQVVTVRSEPDETDDELYSFRLDDEDGFNLFGLDFDDDEVLVFNTSGTPFFIPEDETDVQATGQVRRFNLATVERDLGVDLDPEIYEEYEGVPVIFAQSLALAPDPGEVTDEPEDFYDRIIAVEGDIDEVYGPYTFTLNDPELFDGEDLLVIHANPQVGLGESENVVAVGELRPLVVAEIERDYGIDLGWDDDFENEVEVNYGRRPVLVVREIYPSAVDN